jgi:hypothetical protein
LTDTYFNPTGALIGVLQIPALLVVKTFLGSATAYQIVACAWMRWLPHDGAVKKQLPYMAKYACRYPVSIRYIQTLCVVLFLVSARAEHGGGGESQSTR